VTDFSQSPEFRPETHAINVGSALRSEGPVHQKTGRDADPTVRKRFNSRQAALILATLAIVGVIIGISDHWRPHLPVPSISQSPGDRGVVATPHDASGNSTVDSGDRIITNTVGMKFIQIPVGEFMMGSAENEAWRKPDEILHKVRITNRFYMGMHHVTRGQFAMFAEASHYTTDAEKANDAMRWRDPGFEQTEDHPVVCITWNDATTFIEWLNTKEKNKGRQYRLPTEAEWEYACRAGTSTRVNTGDSVDALDEAAWYGGNSNHGTHPVGTRVPNRWGLYDMHGNVWQWCSDCYIPYAGDAENPKGHTGGGASSRVLRGGSWFDGFQTCRAAFRRRSAAGIRDHCFGFRCCLDVSAPPAPTSPSPVRN
jgi:formylglycine-generating enzyme required for sulfatase activity